MSCQGPSRVKRVYCQSTSVIIPGTAIQFNVGPHACLKAIQEDPQILYTAVGKLQFGCAFRLRENLPSPDRKPPLVPLPSLQDHSPPS